MRDDRPPMTGAERQRAYREKQQAKKGTGVHREAAQLTAQAAHVDPPLPKRRGRPRSADSLPKADDDDVSLAELNARMRNMFAEALDHVGGVQYLTQVAHKAPQTFLRFGAQFVQREEAANPGAFQFVIQQLVIEAPGPVAGVLASPVREHVAPAPRLVANAGEIIDVEAGSS